MGRKLGGCAPLGEGELGPHLTQCGQGRGLLRANFRLDPSNRLATVHERHRQTDRTDRQTTDRWHRANRFTNGRPKTYATNLREGKIVHLFRCLAGISFFCRTYTQNELLNPVSTVQPVIKPAGQQVYRVYKHPTGCQTGCTTGLTTGCIV